MGDLGILINGKLSWNKHVSDVVSKANKIMWLVKRTIGFNAPQHVKLQLYTTLVRSKLDYCTQVWGGLNKANTLRIERTQRSATRYILNFPDLNYKERLCKLNLLPLTYRRDVSDILFFHRCFYEHNINVNNFVSFTSNNLRDTRSSDDRTKLCSQYSRTQCAKLSYFKRIGSMWNLIPTELRSVIDLNIFKRGLLSHFYNLLETAYDADNYCKMHIVCLCSKH